MRKHYFFPVPFSRFNTSLAPNPSSVFDPGDVLGVFLLASASSIDPPVDPTTEAGRSLPPREPTSNPFVLLPIVIVPTDRLSAPILVVLSSPKFPSVQAEMIESFPFPENAVVAAAFEGGDELSGELAERE